MPYPDSSPGLVSYRNNKHDPGTRHLGYRAWTLKLNQLPSEEPRATQYWLLYCIWPYGEYGLVTVDNSKWVSVFESVGVRDILLNAKCSFPSRKKVSVDRFWHLWEQLTASSVWGYKQFECERSWSAFCQKERGIQRKGWVMERCIREWGAVETEGRVLFLRWHVVLGCKPPEVLVMPEIVKCLSRWDET